MTRSIFVLALALALAVTASAPAQQASVLTAAIGANMNHVPSFVGVEKGIYLKHGVDVKLKLLNTGQEMAKALQAGEVQAIGAAFSNYPFAVERGMTARGVVGQTGDRSSRYSDDSVSIWTRKGTGITKVADLSGRKIGTPVGGTGDEYLGVVLKRHGLSRERVTVLNVPPGSLVSALQGGSVDAISAWEPFGSLVEAKVSDAVQLSRGGGHIGYYINISVYNDLIDKNPELVDRFVIGHAEACQWARQHPDEAAEIATRWIRGLDLGVAKKAIRHLVFDPRITRHTMASWEENVGVLIEQRKLRAPVPAEKGIEPRFIEKVMKNHPELFADLKPAM